MAHMQVTIRIWRSIMQNKFNALVMFMLIIVCFRKGCLKQKKTRKIIYIHIQCGTKMGTSLSENIFFSFGICKDIQHFTTVS